MGLFDFFKKKEPVVKKREEKSSIAPASVKATAGKKALASKKEKPKKPKKVVLPLTEKKSKPLIKKKRTGTIKPILKRPHVSEKATDLLEKDQYTFEIFPDVNKIEVKKAIEETYNVDVLKVKIINIPPKKRRMGRISGWRKGRKKAIIKIKKGQKIEVLPR